MPANPVPRQQAEQEPPFDPCAPYETDGKPDIGKLLDATVSLVECIFYEAQALKGVQGLVMRYACIDLKGFLNTMQAVHNYIEGADDIPF